MAKTETPLSPAEAQTAKTKKRKTDRKLRVGIIGCGFIGRVHHEHYASFDDVEVVAACEIDPSIRKQWEADHGLPMYEKWQDMLKKHEFDLISVCTPNYAHYKPTIGALETGCHVFCEKPLAMNATEEIGRASCRERVSFTV